MTEPDPSATTHGAPPEGSPNQVSDALPPLLERTIRILTESALASSHLAGEYPNPAAVRATIERLTLESALRDLERLKELTAEHGLNRRQHTVLTFLVGGWVAVLTTASYSRMAKCSRRTAVRGLNRLVELDILTTRRRTNRRITYSTKRPL